MHHKCNEEDKQFDLGLIAMSAKPYHIGHHFLVQQSSNLCTSTTVFASIVDRKRKGEMPILGADMEKIWNTFLIPNMPHNVNIELISSSPIKMIYEQISQAKEQKDLRIAIFSDDHDQIKCDLPNVSQLSYQRSIQSPNISGKMMRRFVQQNDFLSFSQHLPYFLSQNEKEMIFSQLKPKPLQLIQIF